MSLVVIFERLFGGVEGVDACRVSAVEEHLGDEFDDLLFGPAVVEGAGDVAWQLVGAVEGDEGGDGADAADVAGEGFTLVDVSEEGCVDEIEGVADGLGDGVGGGSAVVVPISPLFGFC